MIIEMLEKRTMLSVAVNAGLLTVTGTANPDAVSITQSGTTLTVVDAKVKYNYAVSAVKNIKVTLGGGADSVAIGNTVLVPASIVAGSGNDSLYGGGGTTSITGGAGSDLLVAGAGASSLFAGTGKSTLMAGSGKDTLTGGAGADLLEGGTGSSLIKAGSGASTLKGGSSSDTLIGSTGADSLVAGTGTDSITAGSGPTIITAGPASSTLVGGSGSDTFVFATPSITPLSTPTPAIYVISPGTGISALSFTTLPASVSVKVDLTNDLGVASFAGRTIVTAKTGQAALITRVYGGAGDDDFTANSANDSLVGGTGNTTLVAGSGNDTLSGNGPSTDYIFAPQSSSIQYTLNQPVAGSNVLDFSQLPASDTLVVNLLYNVMATYDNVTLVDAKSGQNLNFNEILDGSGDDILTANNSGDSILGGSGADTIFGGTGADLLFLGNGYDVVSGNGGGDVIFGGSGDYVIYAINSDSDPSQTTASLTTQMSVTKASVTKANVTKVTANTAAVIPQAGVQVYAGSGSASIVGGTGDDTLEGSGADTIHGMGGNDYLSAGGTGQSVIFGDGGDDQILAGLGDTTISGGGGIDTITAGEAGGVNDFIDNNIPDNSSTSSGGSFIDSVALTANALAVAQGTATPTYPLLGTSGSGSVVTGASANMTVIGGAGDDSIQGGDGPATIVGGTGQNLLVAGYGNDVVQGGAGNDTIVAGFGPDVLQGGLGNTTFFNVNGFADTVIAGAGNNTAEVDPTGESVLEGNIQNLYSPGFVADAPAAPAIFPDLPTLDIQDVSTAITATPAAATPAAAALLPAPTVVGGVLTVGSTTDTANQSMAVSESNGVIMVQEANAVAGGIFDYYASTISSVVANGGPGSDYISFNTLMVPAKANTGNGAANYVVGGESNETLIGGTGADTLIGGPGNNLIQGGNGANSLYGGTGNDTIMGGNTFDNIYPGGFGVALGNDGESDSIVGGTGTECLYMSGNADALSARLDLGTITDQVTGAVTHESNIENYYGGIGNQLIVTPPKVSTFFVNAGSGVDTVFGTGAHVRLIGGVGTPTLYANAKGGFLDFTGTTTGKVGYYGRVDASDSLDSGSGQDILVGLVAAP